MTICPPPFVLSIYADRELAETEAREVAAHLTTCAQCRAKAAARHWQKSIIR